MNSLNRDMNQQNKTERWEDLILEAVFGEDSNDPDWTDKETVAKKIRPIICQIKNTAIRNLVASVGYRVETVLGYLEMGKTEEAIRHLENIHELFVTKPNE